MLQQKAILKVKSVTRQYLLGFTLLVSFFAISGYINRNRPVTGATTTEVLAAKSKALKSGISYNRWAIGFYQSATPGFANPDFSLLISSHQQIAANKYRHIQKLFASYKNSVSFQISALYYAADMHQSHIG